VRLTGRVLRIGLTGGIGAGKSVVADALARSGAVLIDADRLAREVVAPGTDGLAEIVAGFGAGVLGPDGALDRAAMAARVFRDEAARRRLEKIIHPRVRARTAELTAAAPADAIVVNDVPLLVETGLAPTYHLVLVVATAEETRVQRLIRDRGMAPEEAYGRVRAQATDEQRRVAADVLLTNDGTLAEVLARVEALWQDRLVPFERNLRLGRVAPAPNGVTVDQTWPEQYARLAARIAHAAGPLAARIAHAGPTAVPGQPAPDLIEIEVEAAPDADPDALAGALGRAGFPPHPDHRAHGNADPGRPATITVR
jgi:dephospho-CoA kinase